MIHHTVGETYRFLHLIYHSHFHKNINIDHVMTAITFQCLQRACKSKILTLNPNKKKEESTINWGILFIMISIFLHCICVFPNSLNRWCYYSHCFVFQIKITRTSLLPLNCKKRNKHVNEKFRQPNSSVRKRNVRQKLLTKHRNIVKFILTVNYVLRETFSTASDSYESVAFFRFS